MFHDFLPLSFFIFCFTCGTAFLDGGQKEMWLGYPLVQPPIDNLPSALKKPELVAFDDHGMGG
jgi:hypothetical protein